jgi:hypothetical protein
MVSDNIEEANLVDLDDTQLKDFLGACYHSAKNLDEAKKHDPEILALQEKIAEIRFERYDVTIKTLKARLRAGRAIASLRGLDWRIPETSR